MTDLPAHAYIDISTGPIELQQSGSHIGACIRTLRAVLIDSISVGACSQCSFLMSGFLIHLTTVSFLVCDSRHHFPKEISQIRDASLFHS